MKSETVRAAGGLDARASPLLRAAGEGCCEWGFFKLEDRMLGRTPWRTERHCFPNVFSLLWGWRTVANVWVACGGVEFEAWLSSVHKKMAYSRVTSLRTIACSYHVIEISSPTRQRRTVPRELLQHVQSCVVCADRECVERRHLEVLIGI